MMGISNTAKTGDGMGVREKGAWVSEGTEPNAPEPNQDLLSRALGPTETAGKGGGGDADTEQPGHVDGGHFGARLPPAQGDPANQCPARAKRSGQARRR